MKVYESSLIGIDTDCGKGVPIKSWCMNPEAGALEQAIVLAKLPFIFKHVALMPDCHKGFGMPIGGVIATNGVVIPNAVGVDIGCGMLACKTDLHEISQEQIKKIFGGSKDNHCGIRDIIPIGKGGRRKIDQPWFGFYDENIPNDPIIHNQIDSARRQLGTLGSGNHFIEIQKGDDGYIWFMIHSGSRNLGHTIATHYNKLAQDLCLMWHSNVPPFKGADGLAFLPLATKEGQDYMNAMNYALDFAHANRMQMLCDIKDVIGAEMGAVALEWINIHHNYAKLENHFGHNVVVHRKGATSARDGQIGIIPGSQGTCSYIVRGKGNIESFVSCSHGAGRTMSRTKAIATLNLEDAIKKMDDKGIVHGIRSKKQLDESDEAYKDIDVVMEEQKDLVDIIVKLTPLGSLKG